MSELQQRLRLHPGSSGHKSKKSILSRKSSRGCSPIFAKLQYFGQSVGGGLISDCDRYIVRVVEVGGNESTDEFLQTKPRLYFSND